MRRTGVVAGVGIFVFAAALVACGGDDDGNTSSSDTTTTSSTTPETTAASTDGCPFEGDTDPVSMPHPTETLFLTDVRVAAHECLDRIVFEFRDPGDPGYEVAYQTGPITQDGSGNPVEVAGEAFLEIRMQSASGFDFDAAVPSYDGPASFAPSDTAHVRELVRAGDFEAILTWVVGMDEPRPFTVTTLSDPTRVVVDIG